MDHDPVGLVETTPEIRVELVGTGPPGPPGEPPSIGENGNWWTGGRDTGIPATGGGATDHGRLTGRDRADQHPIGAVSGLQHALSTIPPVVEALTNEELEALLT